MLKRIVLIFFTCVLSMAFSFCSFADFVSDLQYYVPTSSNASVIPYSSIGTVSNTVDLSDVKVIVYYIQPGYDDVLYTRITPTILAGNEGASFSYTVPSGYIVSRWAIELGANSNSIPPAGPYLFSFDFQSDISMDYSNFYIWTNKYTTNASLVSAQINPPFSQSSGDVYVAPYAINVTNVGAFNPALSVDTTQNIRTVGGSFRINFTPTDDTSGPSTAGTDTSQQDWENNISSSLGDISSSLSSAEESLEYISQSQNLIIQGIDNVILHISDQLYAFWDQLYNLIHVPTMAKLDDIIEAINNLKLDVTVDLDELTDTLNQNHEDQIANDNAISDQIQNGYDDSSLSSDNDRLNTVIDQYDDVEDQLFTDSKDYISNFEFTDSLAPFLGPLTVISGFLSGIYAALGSLNIPIAFSLSLSIALLMIGWYRFRGGG